MGTKGVPFGFLEFLRTIGGNHALTRTRRRPPGASTGTGSGSGHGRGRGIQPGPVLFEPDHTGLVYKRVLTPSATSPLRYNCWKEPL